MAQSHQQTRTRQAQAEGLEAGKAVGPEAGEGYAAKESVRLWRLEAREPGAGDSLKASWFCARGFVIRAESEEHARAMAARKCGDEGPEVWLSDAESYCRKLSHAGQACVILRDYDEG